MYFDTDKFKADIRARGWIQRDVARAVNRSDVVISNFLNGRSASPRVAKAIADFLGQPLARYLIPQRKRA